MEDDATWDSTSFVYDQARGFYHFDSDGNIKLQDQMHRVASLGRLKPSNDNKQLSGFAHEYSWPEGSSARTPEIIFEMNMFKVSRADLRRALSLRWYDRTRPPRTARERMQVIEVTLARNA